MDRLQPKFIVDNHVGDLTPVDGKVWILPWEVLLDKHGYLFVLGSATFSKEKHHEAAVRISRDSEDRLTLDIRNTKYRWCHHASTPDESPEDEPITYIFS